MGIIKICGITNREDAIAAADFGANALGFIFHPGSPRYITPEKAGEIISGLPPFISTVGVFVNKNRAEVCEIADNSGIDIIQLHGSEPPEECVTCRKVIKAVGIKDMSDLATVERYRKVSAVLLDTCSKDSAGGTGKTFNWDIAIEAGRSGRIILAGGLTPENIEDAIRTVRPYGVDVASGIEESPGKKDHQKLKVFIERARKAFQDHA